MGVDGVRPRGARAGDVRVLLKAADILEELAGAKSALSLTEISRRTQLNKTTCHRILATMAARSFVEQGPDQRYHIGIRLFQIGNTVRSTLSFRDRVIPVLREFAEESEETVFLAVRQGWSAVCLERIEGKYASSLLWQIGGTLPLHIGAAPRVLLAQLSDEELTAYVSRELEAYTPRSMVAPEQIREDVIRTRAIGGVVAIDDAQVGTRGFGAAVRDADGSVIAAISVSGLALTIPAERDSALFDLVREVAARASSALGFGGRRPVDAEVASSGVGSTAR